ncbi:MAG TPA: NAD(P)/FAD-dependent oxidoreductase [Anaerolineae bacterium]|nr:FAD-dependent oxidoreductase [Anaerolineae bacterium]HRV91885.1 NAD(P)/FAD-dependent oxidoreductase [Anaerolineae bacterium]
MSHEVEHDVIIIGAGAAGLAAAQQLKAAGVTALVLEARNRWGGRIWTDHTYGPVELGAEFIHGEQASTWQVIRPAGLEAEPWPRGRQRGHAYRTLLARQGRLLSDESLPGRVDTLFEQVTTYNGPECSAYDRLLALAGSDEEALRFVANSLACLEAADVARLSASAVSHERALNTAGWENFHITAGYDALPTLLAQGIEVRLDTAVTQIEWSDTYVRLETQNGYPMTTRQVIITVPLGVLQLGQPRFLPALPEVKQQAIDRLAMGHVTKLALHFNRSVWPEFTSLRTDGFVLAWWPAGTNAAPVLMGYTGGPAALELAALGQERAIEQGLQELSQILGDDVRSAFVAGRLVDWSTDPWSLGAYTYTPVGAGQARADLAAPLAPTLFFAGEATSTNGHVATVHGAVETGWRAAAELLAAR